MDIFKRIISLFEINHTLIKEKVWFISLSISLLFCGYKDMINRLRRIVPDISNQEESQKYNFNPLWELKRRMLQAFQCLMSLEAIKEIRPINEKLFVVDIGDSAGTHMQYLKELTKESYEVDTLSVNLDPRAIKKIEARGLPAILCRAENLELGGKGIDLFVSFECLEHFHNPAIFFCRLAKKYECGRFVMTVPYVRNSRVGLHNIRNKIKKEIFAEEEHIFELDPEDWELLLLHSGWKVVRKEIYYQYPRGLPVISWLFSWFWSKTDFEGFLGMILEKDRSYSDLYQDWEE